MTKTTGQTPTKELSAEIREKKTGQLREAMESAFYNTRMDNLMAFSSQGERYLLKQIALLAWDSLPLLHEGIILIKPGVFSFQGKTWSIRLAHDLTECLSIAIEGISKSQQQVIFSAPLELGHFTRLELQLADDISEFPREALFQLVQILYLAGYAWLFANQEKIVTGNSTTLAEQIYNVFRRHSCHEEALDALILCAVPQGRIGNGIYLLDLQRYRSSFQRIHACKHFTRQSSLHLMAQMTLHHVPYNKLCVKQSVESGQTKLISLNGAQYNDTKPHLVDAEIAFYKGVEEISVPIVCNENFYLVASFEADENIHREITRLIQETRQEIEQIVNHNIDALLKLEQLISRGAPGKPPEPLVFQQNAGLPAAWHRERYVLTCLQEKPAIGEDLIMHLARGFIAINRDTADSGFQESARDVAGQISRQYGINMKDATIQKFINPPPQQRKRPNRATANKISCWMLKEKLQPKESLLKLVEQGWVSEDEFQRHEQSMNRFSFSAYENELNYVGIVQRYVDTLHNHRARLLAF